VTGFDVRVHAITNGHTDPLYGVDFAPDIVLLHFEAKRTAELSAWATRPLEGRPILIVVGPGGDGDSTRLAIRSGARDFLPEPVGKADLVATLQQVRAELRASATQGRGTIHAFVGASGGAGSSFIAANIAHLFAAHAQRRTALVDLDLNFSPTAHHLNLVSSAAPRGPDEWERWTKTHWRDLARGMRAACVCSVRPRSTPC
jgi:pilus assembly protein CpaE